MAAKQKQDLPDEGLYAQSPYNPNPLYEAAFVIFPKRDGLLVHKKSGVPFQPTWRGLTAAGTLLLLEEELKEILAQKDEDGNLVWQLNPNERPFDPARQQRMAQETQTEPPARPAGNGIDFSKHLKANQEKSEPRPANELDEHFADAPETVTKDGERYRDIVALKRMQETSKKDSSKTYEYWVPYYSDEKGDPKSIGRIMSWGQVADQLRAVVPSSERGNNENGSKVFNKIIELSQPFRAYYTLKDIGNGRSASEFHRIEPLGAA